jgi:hypothetical protein
MAWATTDIDTLMHAARQQRIDPLCLAVVIVMKRAYWLFYRVFHQCM